MDLFSKKEIKKLFKKYKILPLKKLGQNFLIDRSAIKKIIDAGELNSKDIVLEIGPGTGALTKKLAEKAKEVIAVEKDLNMCEILEQTLKDFNNIKVIQEDILKMNFQISNSRFQIPKQYKIVGNLPFYLTAPVIRKFLELKEAKPYSMVFVVQKEVAQRICAKPRDKTKSLQNKSAKMNLLAVSVQFYAQSKIISYISKKSFWPQPKVDSAVIEIIPQPQSTRSVSIPLFFKVVKAGFSQPRKQLINNLSKSLKINKQEIETWLIKNNIQPSQRAETLSIKDWLNLSKTLKPRSEFLTASHINVL